MCWQKGPKKVCGHGGVCSKVSGSPELEFRLVTSSQEFSTFPEPGIYLATGGSLKALLRIIFQTDDIKVNGLQRKPI